MFSVCLHHNHHPRQYPLKYPLTTHIVQAYVKGSIALLYRNLSHSISTKQNVHITDKQSIRDNTTRKSNGAASSTGEQEESVLSWKTSIYSYIHIAADFSLRRFCPNRDYNER